MGSERIHSVEISLFFYDTVFTWNQFWWLYKLAIFAVFETLNFNFWYSLAPIKCKYSWNSRFRAFKSVKMSDFALQESPKLILRKIWVTWWCTAATQFYVKSKVFFFFFKVFCVGQWYFILWKISFWGQQRSDSWQNRCGTSCDFSKNRIISDWYRWRSIFTPFESKKVFWNLYEKDLLHNVEISGFFCYSDFAWNQFWRM